MRALVQRVREASVTVDGSVTGAIGAGLLVLAGIGIDDADDDLEWVARKLADLRIFDDERGVMNRSVRDVDGEILAVSQFTLYGSTQKGNRPSWSAAAPPELARPRFDAFVQALAARVGKPVPTGVFGAYMQVALVNDGPVTVWIDSRRRE
ncbi:MAG TPA: D-aminoacyl-tRNA deacylase [Casimicrobiaceae bacterium]|nr:D-aminoacyl-tRNA deacylase [Casimicrobiaceae bacterium]